MRSVLRILRRCLSQSHVINHQERAAFEQRKQATEKRLAAAMQRLAKQADGARRDRGTGD